MPTSRTGFKSSSILIIFAVTFILLYSCKDFYYNTAPSSSSSSSYQEILDSMVDHDSDVLSDLHVSLRQSPQSSPPAIIAKVTNNGPKPVTILRWESPLDPLALQLGLFSITPADSSEAVELTTIKVSRKMPPGDESLISLAPGESSENELVLKELIVPLDKLKGKKSSVKAKGHWNRVWLAPRDQLSQKEIEELGGAEGVAVSGVFETDVVEISVD